MLIRTILIVILSLPSVNAHATVFGCFYGVVHEKLKCPEKDVTALAKLYRDNLSDSIKAGRGGIFLIRGDGVYKDNIIKYFKKQALACNENDMLVFAYSGHGNANGIYCGYEYVSYSEIYSIFNMSKAKTKIMFIGACHSGGAKKFFNELILPYDAQFIGLTSSLENEISYEEVGESFSFFFKRLILGLKGQADSDNNGSITIKELYNYINQKIAEDTNFLGNEREHPTLFGKFEKNPVILSW